MCYTVLFTLYSNHLFVLSVGLASNLNVNNPDLGSVGFKEPQSRLKKWTAMDVSLNSPLDQNPSKPGEMTFLTYCFEFPQIHWICRFCRLACFRGLNGAIYTYYSGLISAGPL